MGVTIYLVVEIIQCFAHLRCDSSKRKQLLATRNIGAIAIDVVTVSDGYYLKDSVVFSVIDQTWMQKENVWDVDFFIHNNIKQL